MTITLYHFAPSAPSRAALLTAKALNIEVDVKMLDLFKKEQMQPEFVEINPQHCVPTLVDDDFTLWESRAISSYLVSSYAGDDSLYPKDIKFRALVDSRLQFDGSVLYPRIRAICFPVLFLGEIEVSIEKKASLDEAFGFMDVFLDGQDFIAGHQLTIADFACIASISSIIAVGWDVSPYANVAAWVARCASTIPNYEEVNQKGADMFGKAVKEKLAAGQI